MCNIKGKMYHVILNLSNNIKSRIVNNDSVSNFFPCLNGVRQGGNIYPFLFALYLNDLENFLISKNHISNLYHKPSCHTVSKAFLYQHKSQTNAQTYLVIIPSKTVRKFCCRNTLLITQEKLCK
jgi:hypothetical protein